MILTYQQNQFISKQYLKLLNKKITIAAFNNKLKKYFNTQLDFTNVITECEKYNRGSSGIGWFIYDNM
jgi:hypothetical protein